MQNDIVNLYKTMTEDVVESVKKLSELNLNTFETLTSKQVEILKSCMDDSIKQSGLLSETKDIQDFLAKQTELATSCTDKFNLNLTETADIFKNAQEELSSLIEESVATSKANVEKLAQLGKDSVKKATSKKPASSKKVG